MDSGLKPDFSQHVWVSLLGLLHPIEYFITVDHFSLWRRHLAWAKEDGGNLRKYLTERFASSMVLMSLFLGAELSVLFNGSQSATLMRMHMRKQDYSEISFWIGGVIFLSVFLTLSAILSTFTAWGMVSSISECNVHCLLRSSIGQYVTQLPSRLLVASLLSFLLWVVLYLFVMLPGIIGKTLFVVTTCLFLHIVIVYSAFGRLIIHTGAMGEKRIFDSDFEKDLLPSGLHISLLIKATEQQRKDTHASAQYRKSVLERNAIHEERERTCSLDKNAAGNGKEMESSEPASHEISTTQNVEAVADHTTPSGCSNLSREMHEPPLPVQHSKESLMEDSQVKSENKGVRFFPRASVLNKVNMTLKSMRQVVDTTLSRQPILKQNTGESPSRDVLGTWKERHRRSQRRSSTMSFIKEWECDNVTRSMYNAAPPAALDDGENTEGRDHGEKWKHDVRSNLPHPSALNRASHKFKSLIPLAEQEDTPRVHFAHDGSIEEGERSLNQEIHDPTSKTITFPNMAPSSIATISMHRPTEKRRKAWSGSLLPFQDVCDEENPGTGAKTIYAAKRDSSSCDQQGLCGEQEHLLDGVGLQHTNYASGLQVSVNSHAIDVGIIDEVGSETGKENSHDSMPS